jgi:5-methylcytosine-specific restriction endonuclease McrA
MVFMEKQRAPYGSLKRSQKYRAGRKEYAKKIRDEDPEYQAKYRAYRATRKKEYKEYIKIYMREWRKNNKQAIKKINAKGYKKNPDLYKHHAQVRRARKAKAGGTHTRKEWFAKVEAAGWKCHYCGSHLDRSSLIKEHAIALCKGGTDSIDNLVPACRPCNQRKHVSDYNDFIKSGTPQ